MSQKVELKPEFEGLIGDTVGYKFALMISLTLATSGTFIDFLPRLVTTSRAPVVNISSDGWPIDLIWVPDDCPRDIPDPEETCVLRETRLTCVDGRVGQIISSIS